MEELLMQIIGRLDRLDNRIDNIEQTMATKEELVQFKEATDEEFKQIRQNMATKAELEEIKRTMATKAELIEIKDSITKIEENQRKDVITILLRLNEDVTEIKSDVKHFTEVQDRQQDVLELLSSRSIKQEAELKRIQKVSEGNHSKNYGEY